MRYTSGSLSVFKNWTPASVHIRNLPIFSHSYSLSESGSSKISILSFVCFSNSILMYRFFSMFSCNFWKETELFTHCSSVYLLLNLYLWTFVFPWSLLNKLSVRKSWFKKKIDPIDLLTVSRGSFCWFLLCFWLLFYSWHAHLWGHSTASAGLRHGLPPVPTLKSSST